jgi:hypothetical protein
MVDKLLHFFLVMVHSIMSMNTTKLSLKESVALVGEHLATFLVFVGKS